MKVKSKAELKGEVRALGAEVLGQANNRVSDAELKLHRLRNEVMKTEAELNGAKQYRDAIRAYVKQSG